MPTREQLLNEYLLAAMDSGKVRMKSPKAGRGGEALMTAAENVLPFVGAAKSALEGDYRNAMIQAGLDVAMPPAVKGAAALGGKFLAPMLAGALSPKMSKAESIAAGLYHDIGGGLKLQKPVSEVQVKVKEDPKVSMLERRTISPESMQGGVAFPLVGDRSAAGRILEELEGTPVNVRLEGGPEFMRANPGMAWASGKGVLKSLSDRVRQGAESGGDVYGVYTAMGPQSVDFNTMVTEALLKQLDINALRKKDIQAFDRAVRSIKGQGGKFKAPDFPGIENPEIHSLLMEGPGGQRDAFVKAMGKAQFQKSGFPDVIAARVGVTDPALLDIPRGSSGFTVAKMEPAGRVLEESGHTTYPFDLAGEYVGGFERQIPHDIMFHDPIEAKRILGSTATGAHKSLELNAPLQYLDQEWLDRVMKYLENQKGLEQLKAKGGKVEANAFPYGLRHDSELPKGKGYFGPMTTSSGDVMTEYSSSDDAGDYPLVVPTLTADEIRTLLSNGELTEQMLEKAQGWADARRKMGKSPFAGSDELRLPVPKKTGGSTTKSVKKR